MARRQRGPQPRACASWLLPLRLLLLLMAWWARWIGGSDHHLDGDCVAELPAAVATGDGASSRAVVAAVAVTHDNGQHPVEGSVAPSSVDQAAVGVTALAFKLATRPTATCASAPACRLQHASLRQPAACSTCLQSVLRGGSVTAAAWHPRHRPCQRLHPTTLPWYTTRSMCVHCSARHGMIGTMGTRVDVHD
jgi:hypothetical protein